MTRLPAQIAKKLRAKLSSASGETLVETLVATLIMGLVMLMLCTAIVSAAKVNAAFKADEAVFNQAGQGALAAQEVGSMTVSVITPGAEASPSVVSGGKIKTYKQNGYYYYVPAN